MRDPWLEETYFEWLRMDTFLDPKLRREYEGVLRLMHGIPFYYTLWPDENRSGDALSFRQYDFLTGQDTESLDQGWLNAWAQAAPSTLEVLCGIARRWSFYYERPPCHFFEILFRNLQLEKFPGKKLRETVQSQIWAILDIWMTRTFEPNGVGSPFPIPNLEAAYDMRNADIWTQMNAYSAEHFQ